MPTFTTRCLFGVLFFACARTLGAQIPPSSGLPLKWHYVFQDPSLNPPATSMYPEDFLVQNGKIHFLHNTGLLAGYLVTTLDGNGSLITVTSNRVENIGYRLVGVALDTFPGNEGVRVIGQKLYSNNIQAIPPAGMFAISDIIGGGATTDIFPAVNQLYGLNDRGLPWLIRTADNNYLEIRTRVTTDLQFVAQIRKGSGTDATALDTFSSLPRPVRNGQPLGNGFSFSRISGLAKVAEDRYAFLYTQVTDPEDTSSVAVVVSYFDEMGNINQSIDLSAACSYAIFPKMIARNGRVYVYGPAANVLYPAPNQPFSALAVLSETGEVLQDGPILDTNGEAISFEEITVLDNGQLLLTGTFFDGAGNSGLRFYRWIPNAPVADLVGTVIFENNQTIVRSTALFADTDGQIIVMAEIGTYAGLADPTTTPEKTYHTVLCFERENLGISAVRGVPDRQLLLSVLPNPVQHSLTIKRTDDTTPCLLEITDALGHPMFSFVHSSSSPPISVAHWPAGVYILRAKDASSGPAPVRFLKI